MECKGRRAEAAAISQAKPLEAMECAQMPEQERAELEALVDSIQELPKSELITCVGAVIGKMGEYGSSAAPYVNESVVRAIYSCANNMDTRVLAYRYLRYLLENSRSFYWAMYEFDFLNLIAHSASNPQSDEEFELSISIIILCATSMTEFFSLPHSADCIPALNNLISSTECSRAKEIALIFSFFLPTQPMCTSVSKSMIRMSQSTDESISLNSLIGLSKTIENSESTQNYELYESIQNFDYLSFLVSKISSKEQVASASLLILAGAIRFNHQILHQVLELGGLDIAASIAGTSPDACVPLCKFLMEVINCRPELSDSLSASALSILSEELPFRAKGEAVLLMLFVISSASCEIASSMLTQDFLLNVSEQMTGSDLLYIRLMAEKIKIILLRNDLNDSVLSGLRDVLCEACSSVEELGEYQ